MAEFLCKGPDQHHLLLVCKGFEKIDWVSRVLEELGSTLEWVTLAALHERLEDGIPCMILLGPDLSDEECLQVCAILDGREQWQDCCRVILTNPQFCSPGRRVLLEQGLVRGVLGWPVAEPIFKECLGTHLRLLQARDKLYNIQGLFQNEHSIMLIIDPGSGQIVDANPGAVRFYGWTLSELRQMHIGDIVTLSLEEIHQACEQIRSFQQHFLQGRHRLASGAVREVEVWSGPVKRNQREHIYSIVFDVTERNRLQRELEQAMLEAQAATRAKNEFLANMSHEIRTPLNGVLGMLQVLEYTPLNQEQQHFVNLAISAGKRLTGLLSDILDLARIEADKMSLHPAEFSLDEVRQSIVELLFQASSNPRVQLSFDITPQTLTRLVGDETRLVQILFNLVGNALKFTTQGTVEVRVDRLPHTGARVWIFFQVADTGPGISDERIQEVFKPFVQVETSYTRNHQGAGLGLAIVRRLVKLMGGSMSIDSSLGEGTTIGVSLPFYLPSSPGLAPIPNSDSGSVGSGKWVLLVEDDETNLQAGQWILENLGYGVVLAKDGQEALDALRAKDFDVILMDIQLPHINGLEATRSIRSWKNAKARTPIIAMTSYCMVGDREKFLEAGMDDHLPKPVCLDDLNKALGRIGLSVVNPS